MEAQVARLEQENKRLAAEVTRQREQVKEVWDTRFPQFGALFALLFDAGAVQKVFAAKWLPGQTGGMLDVVSEHVEHNGIRYELKVTAWSR